MAEKILLEYHIDESDAVRSSRKAEDSIERVGKAGDKTRGRMGKLGASFKSMVGPLLAVAGAVAAVRGAFRLLSESVKLAGIQQIAERKLEQALVNMGEGGGRAAARLRELAAETQRLSNFGDEQILTAQAMLLSFQEVGGSRGAEMLTGSLVDMAAGLEKAGQTGQDLNQIAATLGKALGQGAGALRRYGISLTDAQEAAFNAADGLERVAILQEVVESNFGGMAAATVDPLRQLDNAVGDLKETLGTELRGALSDVAKDLTAIAQDEGFLTMIRNVGGAVADAVGQFRALVGVMSQVTQVLADSEAATVKMADGTVRLARDLRTTHGLVGLLGDGLKGFKGIVDTADDALAGFGRGAVRVFANLLEPLARVNRLVFSAVNAMHRFADGPAAAPPPSLNGVLGKQLDGKPGGGGAGAPTFPTGGGGAGSRPAPAPAPAPPPATRPDPVEMEALGGTAVSVAGALAALRRGEIEETRRAIQQLADDMAGLVVDVEGTAVDVAESTMRSFADLADAYGDGIAFTLGSLSDLFRQVAGESGAAFALFKGIAVAEAIVSTYVAANRALAEGGPFAGPILAAGIIAQGLANVARIKNTNPSGGGGGAGGGRSGVGRGSAGASSLAAGLSLGAGQGQAAPVSVNVAPSQLPPLTIAIDGEPVMRAVNRAAGSRARRRGAGGSL